ncbi:MAG: hypothetical protein A3F16_00925 [Deltaproteobacteria bacterium RIFCSPHIGHO2_12_FULL_43_9]|nr:MAG: hypothetical protein A3F16_00925 [Deltaproteobacteria bacterium RIFCSPHIGHO2_12_FULL_43_9]
MKKKKKIKLEDLTTDEIEDITTRAENKKNVPLVSSNQVNMRFDKALLNKAKELARVQGLPYTTFLATLLKEDIERLWKVYHMVGY